MTPVCIHGFSVEQCAACRTCPHGLMSSRCGRCQAATASASRRRPKVSVGPAPLSQEHQGFEIFWAPAVDGWQYRAADSAASVESYRSVFLARKAIDGLATAPPPPTRASKKGR